MDFFIIVNMRNPCLYPSLIFHLSFCFSHNAEFSMSLYNFEFLMGWEIRMIRLDQLGEGRRKADMTKFQGRSNFI